MTDAVSVLDGARLLLVGDERWLEALGETLETRRDATVQTVRTAQRALETVRDGSVDCLVTEYSLPETTGVELVRILRESTTTLPVVLATADGSEAIVSDALAADVSAYVTVTEPLGATVEEILDRAERSIRSAQRSITRRERARQFDAVFHDSQTATWVLDPDGTLARVNQPAREMIDESADSLVGDLFWTLPWWADTDGTQRDVRRLVERAQGGRFGNAVVSRQLGSEPQRIVDLSVRPVENGYGELVSIVVEGIDITDQVTLERDLRRSEELHRVTLNNMTDTVLITNEDGEYTYVCPNVHFIFGYTAAEIHQQGTIETLLGEDLFDREELAERGVLKNIECTVTDRAGREHTLLVNVREVSIQGGTLLYSCRDITKRKQREEALATLQETAREFLYAETHQEIAQHVVEDVAGVLDLDASGVFLFDADANELRPAAHSPALAELHGPLPTVHADGKTLPSHSFVNDETLVYDDVHTADRLDNRATGLRSTIYIPLGSHGVFLAGSTEVGVFDAVTRELADLLAATAEAALDRVSRESTLREQDRELQRQNEQLSTLNRINATIREIDQAIVRAETQDEIDHTVCDRLTDTDRFKFAWIGAVDPVTDTLTPRAWAGDDQGYLDSQSIPVATGGTEPAGQTAATGELTVVSNVAAALRDESWRKDALTRDFLSVLSIPLTYNDLTHGVLTVYADTTDAFDETNQAVMTELGQTIGAALSAIERKHALLTTALTRVEFSVEDPDFLLTKLARTADCRLSYQGGMQQTDDGHYVFVTVGEADVRAVADHARALPNVTEVNCIGHTESSDKAEGGPDGGVLQLRLTAPFLALELAEHGAIVQQATADPSTTTLVVDVPENIEIRTITQLLEGTFTSVDLKRKQTRERTTHNDLYTRFVTKLTDRQLEVIQTAYYGGFFESPRENTGEDIATTLGISPTAFYQHVRTVQRKLFETLFEERGAPASALD
jgi:PAS domain S-box-containing protein